MLSIGPTAFSPGFTGFMLWFEMCWKYAPREMLSLFLNRNRTPG